MIGPAQHRLLEASIARAGLDRERVKNWCARRWGVTGWRRHGKGLIDNAQCDELLARLPDFKAKTVADDLAAAGIDPAKCVTVWAKDGSGTLQRHPPWPYQFHRK